MREDVIVPCKNSTEYKIKEIKIILGLGSNDRNEEDSKFKQEKGDMLKLDKNKSEEGVNSKEEEDNDKLNIKEYKNKGEKNREGKVWKL